jgi:glycosyltransferase involved in cell wall biosynthesis
MISLLDSLTSPLNHNQRGWPWNIEVNPDIYRSLSELPRISIVTPSYNQGQFIEETIRSILLQNYPDLELIIIDGGSNDNTKEIIKKYEQWITFWVSEKDKGQTDAINKGLNKCTGVLFNWINSDDVLRENTLYHVAKHYNDNKFNLLAGLVRDFRNNDEESIRKNINLTPEKMILKTNDMYFHQPGVWYITELVKKLGGLDIKYHYCFDWHLVIRYLIKNPRVTYTNEILANFRLHDSSKTVSVPLSFQEDNIAIAKELKELDYFKSLKKELDHYVIMKEWYVKLIRIENSKDSKLNRIAKIMIDSFSDVKNRWSKYTLGTIRNILLS